MVNNFTSNELVIKKEEVGLDSDETVAFIIESGDRAKTKGVWTGDFVSIEKQEAEDAAFFETVKADFEKEMVRFVGMLEGRSLDTAFGLLLDVIFNTVREELRVAVKGQTNKEYVNAMNYLLAMVHAEVVERDMKRISC